MIVFGYECELADRMPDKNETRRVLLTTDEKNNVFLWRGHNSSAEQYTVSQKVVSDILWIITNCNELFRINELEDSVGAAYDIPSYSFLFSGNSTNQRKYLSGYLFTYTRNGECPNTDIVVNLTLEIQMMLAGCGVPINMLRWLEENSDHKDSLQHTHNNETIMKDIIMQSLNDCTANKFDLDYLEKLLRRKRGESFSASRESIESALDSLISDGIILRINNPDIYLLNKRLDNISSFPCSVTDKILLLFSRNPNKRFSFDDIRDKIRKQFDGDPHTETIKANLKSLVKDGTLLRFRSNDSFAVIKKYEGVSKKWVFLSDKEKSFLIRDHLNETVEIRYNGRRKGWIPIRITDQDDTYIYTDERFPNGNRVQFVKDKILDFRYTIC